MGYPYWYFALFFDGMLGAAPQGGVWAKAASNGRCAAATIGGVLTLIKLVTLTLRRLKVG